MHSQKPLLQSRHTWRRSLIQLLLSLNWKQKPRKQRTNSLMRSKPSRLTRMQKQPWSKVKSKTQESTSSLSRTQSRSRAILSILSQVLMERVNSPRSEDSKSSTPSLKSWELGGQDATFPPCQRRSLSTRRVSNSLRKEGTFSRDSWKKLQSTIT